MALHIHLHTTIAEQPSQCRCTHGLALLRSSGLRLLAVNAVLTHRPAKNSLLSMSGLGQGHRALPFHYLLQKLQAIDNWYSFITVPPYLPKTAWEKADPHQSPAMDGAEQGSAQEELPDHVWGALQLFSDSRQVLEVVQQHMGLGRVWDTVPKAGAGPLPMARLFKAHILYKIAVAHSLFLGLSL